MALRDKPKHGSIYKVDGRWQYKFNHPGTGKRISRALKAPNEKAATTNKRQAVVLADVMYEELEAEVDGLRSGYDGTIGRLADLFLENRKLATASRLKSARDKDLSFCRTSIADLKEFLESKENFSLIAAELKASRVELWREWLSQHKKICRNTINKKVGIIKQMFDYAVKHELEKADLAYRISLIKPIKKGDEDFNDYPEVEPANWDDVQKLFAYLPSMIHDMLTISRYTGARPGEICIIRPCDINQDDPDAWEYKPERHKTQKHGVERTIIINRKAQPALQKYLFRKKTAYCFPPTQNSRGSAGKHYTTESFAQLINRAVKAYNRDHPKKKLNFHANQLRHTFGTEVCATSGIKYAQHVLGHTTEAMTKRYTKNALRQDALDKAKEAVKKLG